MRTTRYNIIKAAPNAYDDLLRNKKGNKPAHGKMAIAGIMLLAAFLLSFSPALGGTIIENFNNNQYNTNLWWIDSIGEGSAAIVTGNRLEITLPASAGGTVYMGMFGSNFAVVGDFEMQADFELLTWPANNEAQVGLSINQANDFSIFRRSGGIDEGGEKYFTMIMGHYSQALGAGNPGKLRMKRTGNTMEGSYWNGETWQSVGSYSDPALGVATGVNLNLNRDTSFSGPIVKAALDNIQLIYTNITFENFSPGILSLLLDD